MPTLLKSNRRFVDLDVQDDRFLLEISVLDEHEKASIALTRPELMAVRDKITTYLDTNKLAAVRGEGMIGRQVITTTPDGDSHWTAEAWRSRRWGIYGTIEQRFTSHGECFAVRHDDNTAGHYNPEELELV